MTQIKKEAAIQKRIQKEKKLANISIFLNGYYTDLVIITILI